ncbi:transporter substrate-binding domain-containing protein [Aeromonas salmonicida]|uniref:substrate-binding periplasmic protein n=1 Tax=Aeromonas salmonicida TaxID=645 RepID=UPI00259F185E|nr:transporter substrate-binding domain-containing protein [Aeromonas salmonicida]MDM5064009.1 transporter substrate-binding domain-containing protein [Aeromonas salmonicida]
MFIKYGTVILFCTLPFLSLASINVGVDIWEPYVKADRTGIADKKVSCLMREAGLTPIYKNYPWPRIYKMIRGGEIDISYPWSYTPERDGDVIFSNAIIYDKEVLLHLRDTPIEWTDISDLSKYRIGSQIGYSHVEILAMNNITPAVKVKTEQQLLGMLFSRRIDTFPINASVLDILIQSLSAEKITQLEVSAVPFQRNSMHIISTNDDKGKVLIEKINNVLSRRVCGEVR